MCLIDDNHKELGNMCIAFRRAIIESNVKSLYIMLKYFPFGACGAASELLAKYLENNKYGKFNYILGEHNGYSHAWLEQNGVIIDITLDQFEDYECPIFVSSSIHIHSKFNGEYRYEAGNLSAYNDGGQIHSAFTEIQRSLRIIT